ncbi:endonuclease III [Candidatus Peribacteria bacterium RIFCSPHIGHO2_02_FULL_53_20]|nr:MAG: endonuclease III [Candidatus Peribacteria bacterium RIFCSPHIGHO2_02_FULL_53_20]OGJ69811.1 MAG: endonuclease III [Candidatus Peribacteria bacterium RIFCSPLOWO2_12_FULL_53_10]
MAPLTLRIVLDTLRKCHTPPKTFLHFRTPLDLLVATILSAQCTDSRVNMVTRDILYPKYKKASDYLAVPRRELERDVHSCGTYRNKAKYIQGMCGMLIDQHHGEVPRTMEELTELPGVGRKTASVILSAVFGIHEGIAVDTHVFRVARRLGLTRGNTPEKVEQDLMHGAPKKEWGEVTTLLISHGRSVCTARNRTCDRCPFQNSCPSSWVSRKKDLGKPVARASKKQKPR